MSAKDELVPYRLWSGAETMVHPRLLKNLQAIRYFIKEHDFDAIIIVDGIEGSGKTVHMYLLGHILATELGTKMDNSHVHFDADAYREWAEKQPPGTVGLFDEARRTLNKLRTGAQTQVDFTDWMSWNRDLNMVHIIALPYAHDLVGYLTHARLRSRGFILHHLLIRRKDSRVPGKIAIKRGYYDFYKPEAFAAHVQNTRTKYTYPEPTFSATTWFDKDSLQRSTGFTPRQLHSLKMTKRYWRQRSGKKEDNEYPDLKFHQLVEALLERKMSTQMQIATILGMNHNTLRAHTMAYRHWKEEQQRMLLLAKGSDIIIKDEEEGGELPGDDEDD